MSSLQTVLSLLPGLGADELRQVKDRVDCLIKLTPKKDNSEDWLAAGICYELDRRGLGSFLHTKIGNWYKTDELVAMQDFLLSHLHEYKPKPVELVLLGRKAARALADYIQDTPGFGLRVMLQQIGKLGAALDAAYPGYLAAGMLRRVVR